MRQLVLILGFMAVMAMGFLGNGRTASAGQPIQYMPAPVYRPVYSPINWSVLFGGGIYMGQPIQY